MSDNAVLPVQPIDLDSSSLYLNRELSQLEFQWRVLDEARDPTNPLLERVKFMAIVGSNLEATANNHWVKTGPHVMIVGAAPDFYAMYPKDAQPDTSVPYVMWPGTPYQHLMIPVR